MHSSKGQALIQAVMESTEQQVRRSNSLNGVQQGAGELIQSRRRVETVAFVDLILHFSEIILKALCSDCCFPSSWLN